MRLLWPYLRFSSFHALKNPKSVTVQLKLTFVSSKIVVWKIYWYELTSRDNWLSVWNERNEPVSKLSNEELVLSSNKLRSRLTFYQFQMFDLVFLLEQRSCNKNQDNQLLSQRSIKKGEKIFWLVIMVVKISSRIRFFSITTSMRQF